MLKELLLISALTFAPIHVMEDVEQPPVEEEVVVEPITIEVSSKFKGEVKFEVKDGEYVVEDYKEGYVCHFQVTPKEYYILEEIYLVGIENSDLSYNEIASEYTFTLKSETHYIIAGDFKFDVAGYKEHIVKEIEDSKVGEVYNQYLAPFLGVGLGTIISALFSLVLTLIQKSAYKLQTKVLGDKATELNNTSKNFFEQAQEVTQKITDLAAKVEEFANSSDKATAEAREQAKTVNKLSDEINAIAKGLADFYNHNEDAVAKGVAREFQERLALVEKNAKALEKEIINESTREEKKLD